MRSIMRSKVKYVLTNHLIVKSKAYVRLLHCLYVNIPKHIRFAR